MQENERLYFIIHVTLHVDQSDCFSSAGSWDFFWSLAARPLNLMCLSFFTLHSSSLWRIDTSHHLGYHQDDGLPPSPTSQISPPPPLSIKPSPLKCAWNKYGGWSKTKFNKDLQTCNISFLAFMPPCHLFYVPREITFSLLFWFHQSSFVCKSAERKKMGDLSQVYKWVADTYSWFWEVYKRSLYSQGRGLTSRWLIMNQTGVYKLSRVQIRRKEPTAKNTSKCKN